MRSNPRRSAQRYGDLFEPRLAQVPDRPPHATRTLHVLVTVKAAPNPSSQYGETVCVAGVSEDIERPGWIRLYPINFRYLEQELRFKKYDVITVDAVPATRDTRAESWRPRMDTLRVERFLRPWKPRRPWIDPYVEDSMCRLNEAAAANPRARSLGLVRVTEVVAFDIEPHPGWSPEEQRKIDAYVSQLELFGGEDRTALEAPRFKGFYRWRCADSGCEGHRQGVIDWEFIALQRRLQMRSDEDATTALRHRFLDELCGPQRALAFYVGNQAKRPQVFSVLGVYYPPL